MTDNQTTPEPMPQDQDHQEPYETPQPESQNQGFEQPEPPHQQPEPPYQQPQYQPQFYQPAPQQPTATPTRRNITETCKSLVRDGHTWCGFVLGVIAGIIITIAAIYISTLDGSTLSDTYDTCNNTGDASLELKDNGKTLTLFQSNYTSDTKTLQCVVDETGMPEATLDKIWQTTALSGTQEDSWDGFKATWTYNGGDDLGDGLTVIIESN